MLIEVTPGDFKTCGVEYIEDKVTLTFISEKKQGVFILLYDSKSFELITQIELTGEFKRGDMYSVSLFGADWERVLYRIQEDEKVYTDPFAHGICGRDKWDDVNYNPENIYGKFIKSSVNNISEPYVFDPSRMIIYKLHMRGFTRDLKGETAGDYKSLISRIPYLKKLGINTIELMPIYDFEESKLINGKVNYWGYSDAFYLAPKASYFGGKDASLNCKKLINTLHENDITVIIQFCFNMGQKDDLYLAAVKHFAFEYNVDGFSFIGQDVPRDVLIKDSQLKDKVMFFERLNDLSLSNRDSFRLFTKDDSFVYPIRRLQNRMEGDIKEFCDTLIRDKNGNGYINQVASLPGFTLYDAYSYTQKHNEANGEDNRDGYSYNCVSNNGVEGPTKDKYIIAKRLAAVRLALASLLLSRSIPSINAGDEILNSADGNNNPYCQDNPIGWIQYSKRKAALDIKDYFSNLVAFRIDHPIIWSKDYQEVPLNHPEVSYHGNVPWISAIDEGKKAVGIMFGEEIMLLFNFNTSKESYSLPKAGKGKSWKYITDTFSGDFFSQGIPIDITTPVEVETGSLMVLLCSEK